MRVTNGVASIFCAMTQRMVLPAHAGTPDGAVPRPVAIARSCRFPPQNSRQASRSAGWQPTGCVRGNKSKGRCQSDWPEAGSVRGQLSSKQASRGAVGPTGALSSPPGVSGRGRRPGNLSRPKRARSFPPPSPGQIRRPLGGELAPRSRKRPALSPRKTLASGSVPPKIGYCFPSGLSIKRAGSTGGARALPARWAAGARAKAALPPMTTPAFSGMG